MSNHPEEALPGEEALTGPTSLVPKEPAYPVDRATREAGRQKRAAEIESESAFSVDRSGLRIGGYLRRMWQQDSPIDGLVANAVGQDMVKDPDYSPFVDEEWKRLTEGIPQEYHKEFHNTTSAAHALYTRERILQKLDDLGHLGDLGVPGIVGRLAFGFVEPTNLASAILSGGVSRVAQAQSALKSVKKIKDVQERAAMTEAALKELADATAAASTKGAIATGLGAGAVAGGAFEQARQSVNFENDPTGVLEAALFTLGLSAPFTYWGAKGYGRVSQVAAQERDLVGVARKALDGKALSEAEQNLLAAADRRMVEAAEGGRDFMGPQRPRTASDDFDKAYEALRAERAAAEAEVRAAGADDAQEAGHRAMADEYEAREATRRAAEGEAAGRAAVSTAAARAGATQVREGPIPDRFGLETPARTPSREPTLAETLMGRVDERMADAEAAATGRALGVIKGKDELETPLQRAFRESQKEREAATARAETAVKSRRERRKQKQVEWAAAQARKNAGEFDAAAAAKQKALAKRIVAIEEELSKFPTKGRKSKARIELEKEYQGLRKQHDEMELQKMRAQAEAKKAKQDDADLDTPEAKEQVVDPLLDRERVEPEDPVGAEVYYLNDEGRVEVGNVVAVDNRGRLKVDLHPDMPAAFRIPGEPRFKWLHRSDLEPDSPLYRAQEDIEGTVEPPPPRTEAPPKAAAEGPSATNPRVGQVDPGVIFGYYVSHRRRQKTLMENYYRTRTQKDLAQAKGEGAKADDIAAKLNEIYGERVGAVLRREVDDAIAADEGNKKLKWFPNETTPENLSAKDALKRIIDGEKVREADEFTKVRNTQAEEARQIGPIRGLVDFINEPDNPSGMSADELDSAITGADPFGPGSVGAAQAPGNALGIDPGEGTTAAVKLRFDFYASINASKNRVLRELGHMFVKDPVATSEFYAQGKTASERKKELQRTVVGIFHRDSREAFNEARTIRKLGFLSSVKFHREFYENVAKVARGDKEVLLKNQDIAAQLQKSANSARTMFDRFVDLAKAAGVKGAEFLEKGNNYVNRVWHFDNIREAMKVHGEDAVYRALANAINVPGKKGDVEAAKKFLTAVKKLETSHNMQDIQMLATDALVLRKELDGILTKDEIDNLVDMMFSMRRTEGDAGNAPNLRFRFDIDENHVEQINGVAFKISDMFENDIRVLADRYANSMAGHIAMAERGIKSRADFNKRIGEADALFHETEGLTGNADAYNRQKQLVIDTYDNVTGRPMSMQSFNRADRLAAAFRAYARSVYLGQLGVAAFTEIFNAAGMATTRAFWQQMPTFAGVIRMFRTGRIPNKEFALDIEAMVGFGLEKSASYARQYEVSEFMHDRGLGRFEQWSNTVSHGVDVLSGNNFFTSATRQMAASMMIQKHVNMAMGKLEMTPKQRARLVAQGVDDDLIEDLLADLKAYTVVNQRGVVQEINWEDWQRSKPKSYDTYQLVVSREVRDGIQDHDLGETWPWMHTTTGKIWGELRQFLMVSHAKQNIKNLHFRDQQALSTFMMTFLAQTLAYSAQQSMNFAHNPEELDKRLSLNRIALGATGRMSILGLQSSLMDTGYWMLTDRNLYGSGGTTNTDNRNLFKTPSGMLAAKLLGSAGTLTQALNPFSETLTTQQEARDLMSILPGGNWYLMRNINDAVANTFPKSDLRDE